MAYLKFCTLALSCLATVGIYGQQLEKLAVVNGKVSDKNGEAIPFAHITADSLSIGTVAGENGLFSLGRVPFGSVTIRIHAVGYETLQRTMSIRDTMVTVGFEMSESMSALKEVVIIGENVQTETRQLRESGFSVTALDTRKLQNTTLDVNQVLNLSSGIRIRESGGMGSDFNFSINGLSGKAIKFFVDGIPMESFGSALSLNNVPVNLVERVEVYKGVVPASLGSDAMGGAVNIITNQKLKRYLDASYSFGSFNTHRAALSGGYTHEPTGFTVKANAYYNYSDNNYLMRNNPGAGVSIEVVEGNRFVQRDQRRFHDAYESLMGQVEAGWTGRKWADALLVGLVTSKQFDEMQTGSSLDYVIGNVTNRQTFSMPTLKYRKDDLWVRGLSVTLFGSWGVENTVVADTSSLAVYDWAGKPGKSNATGELGGDKTWFKYRNSNRVARINLGYRINDVHSVNFNFNSGQSERQGRDLYRTPGGGGTAGDDPNLFEDPNSIRRNVTGLSYELNLLDSRWTTTFFGKHYGYGLKSYNVTWIVSTGINIVKKDTSAFSSYFGYGIATRYRLSDGSGIKVSFERAYRLPESLEVFGDGMQVVANIGIRPEESDNVNLGGYAFTSKNGHRVSLEAGLFYRNARNFIFNTPIGRFSSYRNVGFTRIYGIEADTRYAYRNLLTFSLNGSYNHQVDAQEFIQDSKQPNQTYLNRVPNIPFLFGNGEFSIGKDDLFQKDSRMEFRWTTQYVHWYYLTWEAFGSSRTKSVIPSQLLHHAALTYSLAGGKYNLSVECRNLANSLAYDHFKLQKPGRGVYAKLRYFIR